MGSPADCAPGSASLAARIDAWLPQTQCTRCGYPRCRDYAEAVARGEVDVNRCPPGGDTTLRALAALTGSTARALDPACGEAAPRTVARIDESRCIGCTLCIQACPVDAILGAAKRMHTVLAQECTGCELCLPPCPVDCIDLEPARPAQGTGPWRLYDAAEADHWRRRADARFGRPPRGARERRRRPGDGDTRRGPAAGGDRARIRAELQAALERARRRRDRRPPPAAGGAARGDGGHRD